MQLTEEQLKELSCKMDMIMEAAKAGNLKSLAMIGDNGDSYITSVTAVDAVKLVGEVTMLLEYVKKKLAEHDA